MNFLGELKHPCRHDAQNDSEVRKITHTFSIKKLISQQLFTQSQSATVYFICMISYTVAVCDCVFLLYDFFKLGGFRLTYFFLAISFFLLLLLTICFFFHMLYPISTKLGQNDRWVSRYKSYQQFDLKGHVRVTEVKKVILKENATPPTWFIGFWRNLVWITSRQVATEVINSLTLKVM